MSVSNKSIHIKSRSFTASLKSALGIVLLTSSMVGAANASPWPVAVVDSAIAQSLETISIPVIANDIGTGLQITEVNTRTQRLGTASISADKQSVTYRSASGFVGEDSFWYAFKDSQGRTNAAKVTVNVTAEQTRPPQWPTAVNESPVVKYNTPTVIAVLDNDNGVGLTIKQVNTRSVKLGTISITSDGKKVLYTPPTNFSGNDEFWYVFKDAWNRTNAGKGTPVVKPKNTSSPWPTATPDYASTVSPNSVLIPVLDNDIGEGLRLTKVNTTTVKLGKASIVNGSIRYVPPAGFTGQDSFWYDFVDANGRANSTQVFVNVKGSNAQLSSINFCGANYFTDGTAANTSTSNNAIDANAIQVDTNASVQGFTSPAGALAKVGNATYKILSNDAKGKRVVLERNGQVVAVIKDWQKGEIYGVGVRNNTFYFAFVPANQPQLPSGVSSNARRTILLGHKAGSASKTLGSYLVQTRIMLMANQQSTLVRFEGYQYASDGQSVVNPNSGPASKSSYNYHEIPADGSAAVYLGDFTYLTQFGSSVSRYTQTKLFSYNQNLISGIDSDVSTGNDYNYNKLIRATNSQSSSGNPGNLARAVLSNNRLLLTTAPHTKSFGLGGNGGTEDFPAKLYGFDSMTSKFVELATCN